MDAEIAREYWRLYRRVERGVKAKAVQPVQPSVQPTEAEYDADGNPIPDY